MEENECHLHPNRRMAYFIWNAFPTISMWSIYSNFLCTHWGKVLHTRWQIPPMKYPFQWWKLMLSMVKHHLITYNKNKPSKQWGGWDIQEKYKINIAKQSLLFRLSTSSNVHPKDFTHLMYSFWTFGTLFPFLYKVCIRMNFTLVSSPHSSMWKTLTIKV